MNITIIRSSDASSRYVYQTILDCIDGKTVIITKDTETESNWRLQIVAMRNHGFGDKKVVDLAPVFCDFHFLHVMSGNPDEVQILNFTGYKNLIVDNVWSVYHSGSVPTWITAIKSSNPDVNFIGISDTWGDSYKQRIDQRIKDIEHVFIKDFKETLKNGKKKEDLSPSKVIHICSQDISHDCIIESASYSPTGRPTTNTVYVKSEEFLERIKGEKDSEIKVYSKISTVIDLLSQAARSLATAMVYFPTPEYGHRLTHITSQLNKYFTKMDLKGLDGCRLSKDWQIDICSQKSIIYCDYKDDAGFRRYVNWYVKPDFTDGTLEYALRGFSKEGFSVLCVEGQRLSPTEDLLSGCKNVFLFGSNKYDTRLMKNILNNAKDDINIVIFMSKDTIDESNVLKAVQSLRDSSLTVLKHDLSS